MPLCFTKDRVECMEKLEQKDRDSYKKPKYLTEQAEKDAAQCPGKMIQINLYFGK